MIKNIIGPPARGEDFFNREKLIELVWEYLESGNNILLAAPRRYGKTSFMYRLIDHPKKGWRSIHVDAESIRAPVNFIIALLDALMSDRHIRNFLTSGWEKGIKWFRGLINEFEVSGGWDVNLKIKLKEKIGPAWQEKGEELLRFLKGYDKEKLLIIIDELPVMLHLFKDNNIPDIETKTFLYWFRKIRTDPNIGLHNCRFLVGGSIGIENYLSKLNVIDSFNEFQRVPIGELSQEGAKDFLEQLLESKKITLSKTTQLEILESIGAPIPYFIQMFVGMIAIEKANGTDRIGPRKIQELYSKRFIGPEYKVYFQHYYDRLRDYDTVNEAAAKSILKEIALAFPKSVKEKQLRILYNKSIGEIKIEDGFNRLMSDLINDFYITFSDKAGTYTFISKTLCDWWCRYYAF
ncbi:MAG: hypothetical protein PVG39_29795 [Desulfobacteraceae bacterium]